MRNDCEPPPAALVCSSRLLRVAFADPVTAAVAVILNDRSTYCAAELIADPPGVVVPEMLVHVPVSSAVPITAVESALDVAS
jgi:hypothetical protein